MNRILQIIIEEVQDFYNRSWDRSEEEPSIADRIYARQGIIPPPKNQPTTQISGEKVGDVINSFSQSQSANKVVPLFKNPQNLRGYDDSVRGVILNNGEFYLAMNRGLLHEDILEFLSKRGIVPYAKTYHYWKDFPEEFVAVVRLGNSNNFYQSTAYEGFPPYYQQMFDEATQKYPFTFKVMGFEDVDEFDEQLDPNWMISYMPDGYKHNILDEKS